MADKKLTIKILNSLHTLLARDYWTTPEEDFVASVDPLFSNDLMEWILKELVEKHTTRCQFHQHFTRAFFDDILAPKIIKLKHSTL